MPDHPTFKTGAELDELRASDPAAFDDEAKPAEVGEPGETAEAKEARERDENGRFKAKEADAKPSDEAGESADASTNPPAAGEAKPDDNKVDKQAFDGVVSDLQEKRQELRAMRERIAALEAQQQAAAAVPAKDYDAEIAALDQQYDDGDVEFSQYQADMKALLIEKTRTEVLADVEAKRKQEAERAATQAWESAKAAFFDKPEHMALVEGRIKQAAFGAALQEAADEGITGNAELLIAARDKVLGVVAPAKGNDQPNPHANRNASNAAAATKAAATPPALNGGTGNRSSVAGVVDLSTMKPGSFSKSLTKEQQEAMLGEGAL